MLTIFIYIGSFVISIISLFHSFVIHYLQRKKDNKILRPQLFLKSRSKQIIDYIGIEWEINHDEKFKEYGVSMNFTNITDTKILDLLISIDVEKTDTFHFLLSKALEESDGHTCLEKNKYDNDVYTWEKVFGLSERNEIKIDILEGGGSVELNLPEIYISLLMGSMYSFREGSKQSDSEIEFIINISYKHIFSDKYIKIKKPFVVTITFENMIQGPYVVYNSIVFQQL